MSPAQSAALINVLLLALWAFPALGQPAPPATAPQQSGSELTVRELYAVMNERERALDQRLSALRETLVQSIASAEKAVAKAEAASEKRFEGVNEFRNTLKDQQTTFTTRPEVEVRFKNLEERFSVLQSRFNAEQSQKEGTTWLWGVLVGAIGLLVAAGSVLNNLRKVPAK